MSTCIPLANADGVVTGYACMRGPKRKRNADEPIKLAPAPWGITIYTDSAIVPKNPGGHLTWAFWAQGDMGEVLTEQWGSIGEGEGMTNNRGEMTAALYALRWAYKAEYRDITLRSDSRLLVNIMNRTFVCKQIGLVALAGRLQVACDLMNITWQWIPRKTNWRADELSRKPYEGVTV